MKKMKSTERKIDITVFFVIVLLGLFQVFRCLEYPGLYLDAVNPDYLAVQFLFPESGNASWALPHSGFPMLGQLYHGTITAWVQIIIIALFGGASVLTLRIANILYVIGICWLLYLICKKVKINSYISMFMVIAVMLSPQVFSVIRTQYYIKLPGAFFLMVAIYLILLVENRGRRANLLLLSGVCNGIAFYSYFIYLFFVPAMLLFCFYKGKKNRTSGKDILVWITGFCGGSVFYVIGYLDMLISMTTATDGVKANIVRCVAVICYEVVAVILALICRYYNNKKVFARIYKVILACVVVVLAILFATFQYIRSVISPMLDSLNVMGNSATIGERFTLVVSYWKGIMTNAFSEMLMLGKQTSMCSHIYMLMFGVLTLTALIVVYRCRKTLTIQQKGLIMTWILLLVYGIFTLIMISRMGGQHYTITFFLTILSTAIAMDVSYSYMKTTITKYIIVGLSVFVILIGIMNATILCTNLKISGGNDKFTQHINQLADDALKEKRDGKKEVYVFSEWGFMCGFDYLTMNQVKYTTSFSVEEIQHYMNEGYKFKICTWDDVEYYTVALNKAGIVDYHVTELLSGDGSVAFYIIGQTINSEKE